MNIRKYGKEIGDLERLEKFLNVALAVTLAALVAYETAFVVWCASVILGRP